MQWGVDLVGLLTMAKGVKFVVVVVDYFTKWVQGEALATITTNAIMRFLLKSMIYQFGISGSLISNNGWQFDSCHYCD